ncbi:hypothetical protein HDV06_001641 [Boothiomyces sp. JEL0866]|nr:hypothetical protein HDV06_001641 [Boothiomyces sp. JEL0866]
MEKSHTPDSNQSIESPVKGTVTSSPLTDVVELEDAHLTEESGQSFLMIESSESEILDTEVKYRKEKQRKAWEQAQVDQYLKLTRVKDSDSSKSSLENNKKSRQKDEKKSGTNTPVETEEGIMLPDRKRPVPFSAVNSQDRSGRTLIFKYASRGDYATSEALLKAGASLRIADYAGWTPLHEACLEGHADIVTLMLSFDADVDAPGDEGDTPLHDAVGNGHYDVVEILLKHGASINIPNDRGQTSVEFAIEKAQEARDDDESESKHGRSKIVEADKIVALMNEWKEMTAKVVERDNSGQTLLHKACEEGNIKEVSKLLMYGADITAVDLSSWTPLHNAALNGHSEIVEMLLKFGADVDPLGLNNETPLHDSVANGHHECVSVLLSYGAETFRKNNDGKLPVDLVPEKNTEKITELLKKPLEYWQPLKTPQFYPRLLTPCANSPRTPKVVKKKLEKEKVKETPKQTNSFAWGGLDNSAGPFESSREEKKFKALWKTIAKQSDTPEVGRYSDSKRDSIESHEQSHNRRSPAISEPKHLLNADNTFEGRVRHSSADPENLYKSSEIPRKRSQNFESSEDSKKIKRDAGKHAITPNKKERQKEKEKSGEIFTGSKSQTEKKAQASILEKHKNDRVDKTPQMKHKPKLVSQNSVSSINSSFEMNSTERKEEEVKISRKKKRFTISGYQKAGEEESKEELARKIDTTLASESNFDNTLKVPPTSLSTIKSIPTSEKVIEALPRPVQEALFTPKPTPHKSQTFNSNSEEGSVKSQPLKLRDKLMDSEKSTKKLDVSSNQMPAVEKRDSPPKPAPNTKRSLENIENSSDSKNVPEKAKVESKMEKSNETAGSKPDLNVKYCLPLCAYHKTQSGAYYNPPSGNWGTVPKPLHSKVFIDLQLAILFGFKSGRQFLEKFPLLSTRVATTQEKSALETSTLSSRLFHSMSQTLDKSYLPSVVINGKEHLKLVDLDIHLIFWNEDLYNILLTKFNQLRTSNFIQDLEWPEVAQDIKPHYVHKLKRFKGMK